MAAGEELPFSQDDVKIDGPRHRVPDQRRGPGRRRVPPLPGPHHQLHAPSGFGVRWDGGYEAGDEISQYYDNLVGKLCVWGRDRDVAIARMIRALEEFEIEGVATTIPADLAILGHPDFAAIDHSTKWVEDVLDLTRGRSAAGRRRR